MVDKIVNKMFDFETAEDGTVILFRAVPVRYGVATHLYLWEIYDLQGKLFRGPVEGGTPVYGDTDERFESFMDGILSGMPWKGGYIINGQIEGRV